jgi:hypothetical protein
MVKLPFSSSVTWTGWLVTTSSAVVMMEVSGVNVMTPARGWPEESVSVPVTVHGFSRDIGG